MPHRPFPTTPLERLARLRSRAAARLTGPGATRDPEARAADALSVLHVLATSPATALDALTLLHELQVHQVELELQAQELQESRAMLECALRRQITLYDHQPAGCLSIDRRGLIQELNLRGAQMLGMPREQAEGLALDSFFCAGSARRFRQTLAELGGGASHVAGAPAGSDAHPAPLMPALPLTLSPNAGQALGRQVVACLAADPDGPGLLVSLTENAPTA